MIKLHLPLAPWPPRAETASAPYWRCAGRSDRRRCLPGWRGLPSGTWVSRPTVSGWFRAGGWMWTPTIPAPPVARHPVAPPIVHHPRQQDACSQWWRWVAPEVIIVQMEGKEKRREKVWISKRGRGAMWRLRRDAGTRIQTEINWNGRGNNLVYKTKVRVRLITPSEETCCFNWDFPKLKWKLHSYYSLLAARRG